MHLVVLQMALYYAALCNIGEGKSSTGHWENVVQENANWEQNLPLAAHQFKHFIRGYSIPTERAVTYRRKANPSLAQTRILFVDYVGVTWTYSQETASWAALPTRSHFYHLHGNSITSLCETRAVAFGGYQQVFRNGQMTKSWRNDNRLWLFNGENEEWTVLQNLTNGPQARHGHKTFTQYKNKSTCQCKESMFVYGGVSPSKVRLEDIWELRCVDDRSMKYQWIQINATSWPLQYFAHRHAVSVDSESVYWLTRNSNKAWILDMTTKKWDSKVINTTCPNLAFTYYDQANMVYDKEHQLLIIQIQSSLLGVYDVNKNRFHCVNVEGSSDTMIIKAPAKILLLENKLLLVAQLMPISRARIRLMVLWKKELRLALRNGTTHKIPRFGNVIFTEKHPVFEGGARLVKISDAVWYLMVQEKQTVQMWRYENDHLRWTLYDPDQKPKTDEASSWELMAYSATENNCVAIFGNDHLWIYSTDLRIWTRVLPIGNAPNRLTSYATMNLMNNGSLLLFGGIDNKVNSLWMTTVDLLVDFDFKQMKVTWKRICCDGRQREPTGPFQRWSSAIWNNTFYVYFLKTKSACEWKTYHTRLGIGKLTWNVTSVCEKNRPAMSNTLKNVCSASSAANGRFAFATTPSGDLLIEDFSRINLKMIRMANENSSSNEKNLVVGSGNAVFNFLTLLLKTNKTAIIALERFDLRGCKPGTNSSDYTLHPCRPCPMGQYNDHYGGNCAACPPGLVTRKTGSTSIQNCTCPVGRCANGICIIQSDYTTHCTCNAGFTGPLCETPTTYIIGTGTLLGVLLIAVFLYIIKRAKEHQNVVKYTRVELEMAEENAAELFDIWSVDENEVEFDRIIGQGSFGDVWIALYRDQNVAVKVLKITEQDCTNEQLQEFKDESELLRSIFHAHIVRLIGTGKTAENKPFIVLEYMERGSARKELDDKYGDHPMEIELQVKYALHAAKGMRHLHRINRMHRDLKCDNLLVNNLGIVKVADLGCTKIVPKISDDNGGSIRGTRAVGTAFFRAPEILRGEAYSVAVDVYSYGITLWELMTAKHPYFEKFEQGLSSQEILNKIVQSGERPECPVHCDSNLMKLAKKCWSDNPFERPTFEEIVPLLKGISFLTW